MISPSFQLYMNEGNKYIVKEYGSIYINIWKLVFEINTIADMILGVTFS